jgi:hypothetical protein
MSTGGPPSPTLNMTQLNRKNSSSELTPKPDKTSETITRVQNDYSPMLPSIHGSPKHKPNFLKNNMSIANQVIRSYRSFSRRHAYNARFEVTSNSEDQDPSDFQTYDLGGTNSTKAASSPKNRQNRAKSQLSKTANMVPEKIIQVKPIQGKEMLESIQETKDSEQR